MELEEKVPAEDNGGLTEEDTEMIMNMADFYGITPDEAYGRFLSGNYDGLVWEPDEDDDDE